MKQSDGRAGLLVTMIFVVTTAIASGCASHQPAFRSNAASADTVEVCETRGTRTICSRHHATDYAMHMERYREFEEMRQLDQSEEW